MLLEQTRFKNPLTQKIDLDSKFTVTKNTPHDVKGVQTILFNQPFELECGVILPELEIAYNTYGNLNAAKDNAVWVCHALSANSDVADWWSGLIGSGKFFDPKKYFIVCANIIGSHYGSTSALSINPKTNEFYGKSFPVITIRDIARAHQMLAEFLEIKKIKIAIGGSMGGQQVLEWAIQNPNFFTQIAVIACGANMTAWSIGLNETQRMAIEADESFSDENIKKIKTREELIQAGAKGLEAARAIGMMTYRSYSGYNLAQSDNRNNIDTFKVQTYQRYQGEKLRKRFSALCYYSITKIMDSHNVGRNRESIHAALSKISARALVVGIETDVLFPLEEQVTLASHIPNKEFRVIKSKFGHDGFLIEFDQMERHLANFFRD